MRIHPIGPYIPFTNNKQTNTDDNTKSTVQPKSDITFKQVLQSCQPIKPSFTGHWPPYYMNSSSLDVELINHLYPMTYYPPKDEEKPQGILHFIV